MSPAARVLRWPVLGYQAARAGRTSPCRFDPSCSTYALQALEHHGAIRGTWFAVRRIARCHPWGGHGPDPIPPKRVDRQHHEAEYSPDQVTERLGWPRSSFVSTALSSLPSDPRP